MDESSITFCSAFHGFRNEWNEAIFANAEYINFEALISEAKMHFLLVLRHNVIFQFHFHKADFADCRFRDHDKIGVPSCRHFDDNSIRVLM